MIVRTTYREESPELAAAGTESLRASFARIKGFSDDWFHELSIEPDSPIGQVDRWARVQPLSTQLINLVVSARDHVRMIANYVEQPSLGVPTLAAYTLTRTSIEASSLGIWLVTPGTLNKRLLRSLCLAWHNESDVEDWARQVGVGEIAALSDLRGRLLTERDARAPLRQHQLDKFPTWTSIVRESESHVPVNPALTPLAAWKAASGFAHSNLTTIQSFLEHEISDDESGRTHHRMTSRFSTVAMFLRTALDHLDGLTSLIEHSAKSGRCL